PGKPQLPRLQNDLRLPPHPRLDPLPLIPIQHKRNRPPTLLVIALDNHKLLDKLLKPDHLRLGLRIQPCRRHLGPIAPSVEPSALHPSIPRRHLWAAPFTLHPSLFT